MEGEEPHSIQSTQATHDAKAIQPHPREFIGSSGANSANRTENRHDWDNPALGRARRPHSARFTNREFDSLEWATRFAIGKFVHHHDDIRIRHVCPFRSRACWLLLILVCGRQTHSPTAIGTLNVFADVFRSKQQCLATSSAPRVDTQTFLTPVIHTAIECKPLSELGAVD